MQEKISRVQLSRVYLVLRREDTRSYKWSISRKSRLILAQQEPLLLRKAGFPLANIFARSDVFPLSLSFRLKPSGTNRAQTKEKSRFARKYSLVENRL